MALAFLLAAAKKDLLRRLRDPFAFLLWLGIPLVLAALIGLVNSGGGKPRGRLLVADQDGSFLSRAVGTAFAQKPLAEFFDVETVEETAGRARMDRGDASVLLVIPKGFGHALLEDEPARLELVKNPAQHILPAVAEETLGLMTEAVFYAQRVAGDRLRERFSAPVSSAGANGDAWTEALVSDFSVEIHRTIDRLSKFLSPPVLQVDVEKKAATETPGPSFGSLFFPSMLFMALFFMAQGLSEDVWREKADGTLRRAMAAPQSIALLLAGKLAAASVLLLAVAVLGLSIATQVFGFRWLDVPVAAAWIVGSGLALTVSMMLIQLFASSQRAGHLLTNTVVFPLTMIGGSFFPFEAMPAWMAAIGKRTPNGWALERFKAILLERATSGETALAFVVLAAATAVLFFLCQARLRGAFARA
jgi:ABC-type multidrug transport system permease subunit